MATSTTKEYISQVTSGLSSLGINISRSTEKVIARQQESAYFGIVKDKMGRGSYDITSLKFLGKEEAKNVEMSTKLVGTSERVARDLAGIGAQFDR